MQPKHRLYIILLFCLSALPLVAKNKQAYKEEIDYIESQLSILEDSMELTNARSMIDKAIDAFKLSQEIGYQRGIIKSQYVLGLANFYTGDYKQSLNYFQKTIENRDIEKFPHYISMTHKGKGDIFHNVGLDDWAKSEYNKGLKSTAAIRKRGYKHIINAILYAELASVYYQPEDSQQMDSLTYYLSRSEKELSYMSPDFVFPIAPVYLALKSNNFMLENNPDSARLYVDKMLRQVAKYKNVDWPYIYLVAGNYHAMINQPDSVEYYYRYALQRYWDSGVINDLPRIYEKLSLFYESIEQPDSAKYYHQLYKEADIQQSQYKLNSSAEIINHILNDIDKQHNSKTKRTMMQVTLIVYVFAFLTATAIYLHYHKRIKKPHKEETTKLSRQINHAFDEVVELAKKNDPLFITRFQEVYSTFWDKLNNVHPELSPAEQHLCAMTYLNFTTQQIADYSYLQMRSVQTRRSRLRKKIGLDSGVDLYNYLKSIDMIDES